MTKTPNAAAELGRGTCPAGFGRGNIPCWVRGEHALVWSG